MGSRPCRACWRPSGKLADASGRLARSFRETTPSDVLPLDPHEGGDRTAFHPAGESADEEWGDDGGPEVVPKESPRWNAPIGGLRGCPMKRRDLPQGTPTL